MENESLPVLSEQESSLKTITTVIYALQAAAFLFGLTFIVAVIVNYVKKDDARGTLMESHFIWQIRTFWFSLLWFIIAFVTTVIGIGIVIHFANIVWVIYRIVKGWLRLSDNKPMYT